MEKGFKIIVFTHPELYPEEAGIITELLGLGAADCIHIRKPEYQADDVRRLIGSIPSEFHGRLRLHSHFELLQEFDLAGVQINGRCGKAPATAKSITKSCHSLKELSDVGCYEYVTLSPVFDSISKAGYRSAFNLLQIRNNIAGRNVIALGGVDPSRFTELKDSGFSGAALLGYVWNRLDTIPIDRIISEIRQNQLKL